MTVQTDARSRRLLEAVTAVLGDVGGNTLLLLQATLPLAVARWQPEVHVLSEPVRHERRLACAEAVGSTADVLIFQSKKKGRTAEAFNRTAEAIALLTLDAAEDLRVLGMVFPPYPAEPGQS